MEWVPQCYGTPGDMNCYGEPGPPLDWAFAWADGSYEISAPAACLLERAAASSAGMM